MDYPYVRVYGIDASESVMEVKATYRDDSTLLDLVALADAIASALTAMNPNLTVLTKAKVEVASANL